MAADIGRRTSLRQTRYPLRVRFAQNSRTLTRGVVIGRRGDNWDRSSRSLFCLRTAGHRRFCGGALVQNLFLFCRPFLCH